MLKAPNFLRHIFAFIMGFRPTHFLRNCNYDNKLWHQTKLLHGHSPPKCNTKSGEPDNPIPQGHDKMSEAPNSDFSKVLILSCVDTLYF
jgi:hypothetical protein